jgi:formylglycine-generating enzyme required for sulfatase activity
VFPVTADCKHPVVEAKCRDGFCTIPPGCFVAGSPECQPQRGAYSEPEVQITLTHSFELAQHEVTQAEWTAQGFPNRATPPSYDAGALSAYGSCLEPSCPATNLTWFDALAYANRVSRAHTPPLPECYVLEGCTGEPGDGMTCTSARTNPADAYACRGYRLPTEMEWEYAARAGTRTPYYGGPMLATKNTNCASEPFLDPTAWHCFTASHTEGSPPVAIRLTHPVMTKAPNAWGLYDMLGNVAEWCAEPKLAYPTSRARRGDGWRQPTWSLVIEPPIAVRGMRLPGGDLRATMRHGLPATHRDLSLGVRPARPLPR